MTGHPTQEECPSERERRIVAVMGVLMVNPEPPTGYRHTAERILDAADEAVPVVSEAEYSAEVNERVRLSLNVTRDAWEAMEQQAERAEAAARDFAKVLEIVARDDRGARFAARAILARHPSFSGEQQEGQ